MSDIKSREQMREANLRRSGPLQTQANHTFTTNEQARGLGFMNVEDILEGHKVVTIPDALRDGYWWTFRMVAQVRGDRVGDFYDYRFDPTYCRSCDAQYRFPVCYLVQYIAPNQWHALWTCPYGHTSQLCYGDEEIQLLLCEASHYRLIERHG